MTPPESIPIANAEGGLPSAVLWSHLVIEGRLCPGDIAIDATAGNGHDSLFLAEAVGPDGSVFIYDVQSAALKATRGRLETAGVSDECFRLLNCGHEGLAETMPADLKGKIRAIMFNLGYLPGSDRTLITQTANTLTAITSGLEWLGSKGIMTVVVYPGHEGGAEEARQVEEMASRLSCQQFEVQHIRPVNRSTAPPELWVFLKKPSRSSGARPR